MLVIRQAQVDAFAAVKLSKFEARMVAHLRNAFPDWSAAKGPEQLAGFVRLGIERARDHGFKIELDVARYLHLMQALGPEFDRSPEYPWVEELLEEEMDASEKMDRLRDGFDYQVEARRISGER